MTAWWLALRYFGGMRRFFNLSTGLSVLGMTIGVSALVVSMAVFSGYVTTLENTVQDAFGHLNISKRGMSEAGSIREELKEELAGATAETPYVSAEAIVAHKGRIGGVALEGVDLGTVDRVLSFSRRVIAGTADLGPSSGDVGKAIIGKGIAEKFGLSVGDEFRVVVPLTLEFQSANFRPKLGRFKVTGIISYGRYDFDSRYIVMALPELQNFIEIGRRVTGYRVRLRDPYEARQVAMEIASRYEMKYWARDWLEINKNLLEAARLEKAVLFFVLMILVVAAAFNIANTLFISVVKRYRDISVLKTLGATNGLVWKIFTVQGLFVGAIGAGSGVTLGLILCRLFEWAQQRWQVIPPEVYKLDHIDLEVSSWDLLTIVGAAMFVCFIATLVPARRGARISPVEGLRYE